MQRGKGKAVCGKPRLISYLFALTSLLLPLCSYLFALTSLLLPLCALPSLDLNLREAPGAGAHENNGYAYQHSGISGCSEMCDANQYRAHAIDAVGKRVEARQHRQHLR